MGINQRQNVYNKSPHKIISSQKCAGYLMFHGCRLIRTEQNQNNPKRNVFIFYDDDLVKHYLIILHLLKKEILILLKKKIKIKHKDI